MALSFHFFKYGVCIFSKNALEKRAQAEHQNKLVTNQQ